MQRNNLIDVTDYINSKLGSVFSYVCSRYWVFTTLCFLMIVVLIAPSTPFGEVLRWDATAYLLKAFEITEGNWTPTGPFSIGWSIVLAFFLKIFGIQSIFDGMVLSRTLSVLLMGLCIFPFSGLAATLVGKKCAVIAVVAFTFAPTFIRAGGSAFSGYTESLFILLVISTMYYLADSDSKTRNIFIATILASLSYYVRPNGIFMLGVVFLYLIYLLWRRKINWSLLIFVPLLFLLVSLPHMYMRHEAYGSPLDFGRNSAYFADSYRHSQADSHARGQSGNISNPSIFDYLKTHDVGDYYRKFARHGLFRITKYSYELLGETWLLLFLLGSVNYLLLNRFSKFDVIFIFLLVFVAGLTPVFEIYGNPRHLFVLLPFTFIISSKFLIDLTEGKDRNNILVLCFILLLMAQIPFRTIISEINIAYPKVHDEWAIWGATNLQKKIAIVEGRDLIEMILLNEKLGSENLLDLSTGQSNMFTVRPGNHGNLEDAMRDFKERGVKYLMLNKDNIKKFPYLYEVYESEWSEHFVKIKSFRGEPADKWIIRDMDVFNVVY